jgi:phage protein D
MSILGLGGLPALAPADCIVRMGVGGTEITSLYPLLTEVSVDCSRSEAWVGRLQFAGHRDESGSWAVQDAAAIKAWEPVTVEAGFGTESEPVIEGYVRQVRADYPEDAGSASVVVELQDSSLAFDREHQRKAWGDEQAPADDAMIVQQIVGDHGLQLQLPVGPGRSNLKLNQDGTDIAFLRERAEANGYELIFAPDGLYFGPPRLASTVQATIMVYAGAASNCVAFSASIDGHAPEAVAFDVGEEGQPAAKEVVVKPDLDDLGPQPATGGGAGLKPFVWRMAREGGAGEAELTARAQQKANAQSLRVHAEGDLDGSLYGHVLRVGARVGVDGVGNTFSGTWYVDTVSHRFDAEGYRQAFTLLRNAVGDNLPPAGDRLAGVRR